MEAMTCHPVVGALRDEATDLAQTLAQIRAVSCPALGPLLHARQLCAQYRRLELRHAEVVADHVVLIPFAAARAPTVFERPCSLEQLGVVGRDRTALTRVDVFGRLKAEAGYIAQASGRVAAQTRAVRLAGILDQGEPVAPGDR